MEAIQRASNIFPSLFKTKPLNSSHFTQTFMARCLARYLSTQAMPNQAMPNSYQRPNQAMPNSYERPNQAMPNSYQGPNQAMPNSYQRPNQAMPNSYQGPNQAMPNSYQRLPSHGDRVFQSPSQRPPELVDNMNQFQEPRAYTSPMEDLIKFCKEGKAKESIETLEAIEKQGIQLEPNMVFAILQVCGDSKALEEEAEEFVDRMMTPPPILVLETLKNYGSIHGDIDLVDRVEEQLIAFDPSREAQKSNAPKVLPPRKRLGLNMLEGKNKVNEKDSFHRLVESEMLMLYLRKDGMLVMNC
ncbi:hypothetical protein AMTR_s00071p00153290 [Amborella trichopoda]|uniref:Pentacotripeptide-repeat region of PRORP domain-containing protein n=1 Tax=Amborella trichopoda TaxID=13333 RepID=U5DHL2_AMBTC|nr:hypothetical protein AMTR_s00071p00153290 [Amborella trichopoda]